MNSKVIKGHLKIDGKHFNFTNLNVDKVPTLGDFLQSYTSCVNNPRPFTVEVKEPNIHQPQKYQLSILSTEREDGSGKKFLFVAYAFKVMSSEQPKGSISGYVEFE